MNKSLLLPHRYKKPGWYILIPAVAAGLLLYITGAEPAWLNTRMLALVEFPLMQADTLQAKGPFFHIIDDNISNELVGMLIITGALLVGFSKEHNEDEFIARVRLNALLWAVLVNYSILLFCFLFFFGLEFYSVMIYNMFTVLFLFILRFHYLLYRQSRFTADEK